MIRRQIHDRCGNGQKAIRQPARQIRPLEEAMTFGDSRARFIKPAGTRVGGGERNYEIAVARRIVAGAFKALDGFGVVALKKEDETSYMRSMAERFGSSLSAVSAAAAASA